MSKPGPTREFVDKFYGLLSVDCGPDTLWYFTWEESRYVNILKDMDLHNSIKNFGKPGEDSLRSTASWISIYVLGEGYYGDYVL